MFQNEKHVGQVFQGITGVLTALSVHATVIFMLLGVFGVVDMGGVRERGFSLAYVVAVGAFALSPVVAVGIVAVGLFNALGIIAIGAGSARGIIAISAGGRASGRLLGIGEEARCMLTVSYSSRKAPAFGRWPQWPRKAAADCFAQMARHIWTLQAVQLSLGKATATGAWRVA